MVNNFYEFWEGSFIGKKKLLYWFFKGPELWLTLRYLIQKYSQKENQKLKKFKRIQRYYLKD